MSYRKIFKQKVRVVLWAILFAAGLFAPIPNFNARADHLCYGLGGGGLPSCQGLFAGPMNCDALGSGYLMNGGAKVEKRYSTECNAKWTRIVNLSGSTRYTAGSTKYGCTYYCYHQSIESGGYSPNSQPIVHGLSVYIPMVGLTGTPTISCGTTSTSMIPLPYGGGPPLYLGCTSQW